MDLMNRYLPHYQFAEEHSARVAAPPARVLEVVGTDEVVNDPVAQLMIALREAPGRLVAALGGKSALQGRPAFGAADFTELGREPGAELALGLAGRFWQADYGLLPVPDAQAFLDLQEPGIAKLVLNFTVQPDGAGTLLTTRTRVWCNDAGSLRRFRPYWLLIRPVSGLIRRRLLARAGRAALR